MCCWGPSPWNHTHKPGQRVEETERRSKGNWSSWRSSYSLTPDSLRPHRLYSPRNSPGPNSVVGSLPLLQGIFLTQGLNPGLQHCRQILYQLNHKRSPWGGELTNNGVNHTPAAKPPISHWKRIGKGNLESGVQPSQADHVWSRHKQVLLVHSACGYYVTPLSVQFSCSVVFDSLRPHGLQPARPPGPSPTPRVYSNSCPLSRWCHPAISSSVVPFSQLLFRECLFQPRMV